MSIVLLGRRRAGKQELRNMIGDRKERLPEKGHITKILIHTISEVPSNYSNIVEAYLETVPKLINIFVLINADLGITATDRIMLERLNEYGKPFTVVISHKKKPQDISADKLLEVTKSVIDALPNYPVAFQQPFLVSSNTGAGINFLKTYMCYCTGHLHLEQLGTDYDDESEILEMFPTRALLQEKYDKEKEMLDSLSRLKDDESVPLF